MLPPTLAGAGVATASSTVTNWEPADVVKTWQFYALVVMFILTTQSGLLIIGNAAGMMKKAAKDIPFFAANAWILVSYGGLVNASGRVGTGFYSDKIGRLNAYCLNCGVSALCLFALPYIISTQSVRPPLSGGWYCLLAVWWWSCTYAFFCRGFLRTEKSRYELWPHLYWLGSRCFRGQTWWYNSGYYR